MLKKLSSLLLIATLSGGCASTQVTRSGAVKPKPFVTPYEYFTRLKPAVQDEIPAPIQPVAYQSLSEDTREDHTQAIVVGSIIGVLAVGGLVTGILLLK